MLLYAIGVVFTYYVLRDLVRTWHEPDNVHWVGPLNPEPEDLELEPDMHPTPEQQPQQQQPTQGGHGKDDGHGHGDKPAGATAAYKEKQRPVCPYWWGKNCTFEKPLPTPVSCCDPLASDKAKPQQAASRDLEFLSLVEGLPKELRDLVFKEALKVDRTRAQASALAAFIDDLPPLSPVAKTPSENDEDKPKPEDEKKKDQ